ncbi:YeeE/YedE family protein [Alicyclobacillus fastidiosus]|uniref:YeeE/YedE family protein n=1 Tax=Alicyclobacillus fastidiosus TaxID=392011 RepID=A0ABV5AE22_9BACL|nr:YeeE/YedE family protein [Alicyclobacillus fastidiosus]WEH08666.1 YeeE/YedE family protein [Alicyclobacillus fastidiosus]
MAISNRVVNLDGPTAGQQSEGNRGFNKGFMTFALILFLVGTLYIGFAISLAQALLYLVGGVLGITLYHARYGFTSAWRNFIVARRGAGLRSHMVMFLIANILFLPLLLRGHIFGHPVVGSVSPVGLSVFVGSFLFGLGMQVADGCASGTLFHTGGGDVRGLLVIVAFIVGSVLGSWNFTWWQGTWHTGPVSFIQSFGAVGGFLFNLLLLAIVFFGTLVWERRKHGTIQSMVRGGGRGWKAIFRGPWSLLIGSVILAVGNAVVMVITGGAWGVTFAFALVGSKISQAIGIPVTHWGYWQVPSNATAFHSNLFTNSTFVLDISVIVGALLAASLAGRFPKPYFRRFPARMIVGLLVGGVLMGYGARIAFGCNIGAYFDGIASFSLHGWAWMVCGFIGSIIGVKVRPWLSLSNRVD